MRTQLFLDGLQALARARDLASKGIPATIEVLPYDAEYAKKFASTGLTS